MLKTYEKIICFNHRIPAGKSAGNPAGRNPPKKNPVISIPNSPGKGGAHSMMTKPKAPTCHIEIRFLRMRYPPGIDNLHFYTNLIYSILQKVVIGISASGG